ncbi:hypothetical protein PG997_000037 [Apiospora hydei]|uniref:Rhodopsin domain-containing protein n=1 Tax=Apiospora hydei TaxID=1337664 RepID=A0ABR1X9Q6_9PEZI
MSAPDTALPAEERVSLKTFLNVTWAATGVAGLFLITRLTIRLKSFKRLTIEDYLIIVAWLLLLVSIILWQVKGGALYWMYDVQSQRRPPTPEFYEAYGAFLPLPAVWNILFYTSLWAVKCSFLIFFRTVGLKVSQNRVWWWIVSVIAFLSWIVCIANVDYKCTINDREYIMSRLRTPFFKLMEISADAFGYLAECFKRGHVKFQDITFYVNMGLDVLTDLLILTIPFRMLWEVRIPRHKKALLLGVFSLTILIMVVAIIRVTVVKRFGLHLGEQIASIEWLNLWSFVEVGAAIAVACTGSFRQLFVYAKKQQARETNACLRSFVRGLDFYQRPSRSDVSRYQYRPAGQIPRYPAYPGSDNHIVPLGPVYVRRSFDVVSVRSTPGDYARLVPPPGGYELV